MPRRKKVAVGEDGWEIVTSGPPLSQPDPLGTAPTAPSSHTFDPSTFEKGVTAYNQYRQTFRNSEPWGKVKRFVKAILVPYISPLGLNKCVCLGLGSLDSGLSRHSNFQLAFLEALIEVLEWRTSCNLFFFFIHAANKLIKSSHSCHCRRY